MREIDGDALIEKAYSETEGMNNSYKDFGTLVKWLADKMPVIETEWNKGKWIPIKSRPMDEDERKEWSEKLGYELEDDEAVIYDPPLPDEGKM